MIPSFDFSISTNSTVSLTLGCKATIQKNGYVASIELSNLFKNMGISFGAGRKLQSGHAFSIKFEGTKNQGLHLVTLEYLFDAEDLPKKPFGIHKIGSAYSIGVRDNWGLHAITSGIQGVDPYPYNISWNHTYAST